MDLEDVQFATPCHVLWEDMVETGDERVRLCEKCDRNVFNTANMSRDEAVAFLQKNEGSECIQIWKREDGTVVTADCPSPQKPPPKPPVRLGGKPMPPPPMKR